MSSLVSFITPAGPLASSSSNLPRLELAEQLQHVRDFLRRELADSEAARRACFTCSFQAEDVLLLGITREFVPDIPVLFLETGYHFAEVLDYRDRIAADWNLNLINLIPKTSISEQEAEHGVLHQTAPDRCCGLRKVEPLFEAVAQYGIWITGLRREQSRSRTALAEAADFHLPSGVTVRKLSPLADWSARDVWQLADHLGIPLLPLYQQGYTSIGCQPCTTLPTDPNDARSGRWAGKKVECGIHIEGKQGS